VRGFIFLKTFYGINEWVHTLSAHYTCSTFNLIIFLLTI
jgi:hypothetical protein